MAVTSRKRPKRGQRALPSPEANQLKELISEEESRLEEQLRASLQLLETSVGGRNSLIDALTVSKHPSAKRFLYATARANNGALPLYDSLKRSKLNPDELIRIFTEGSLVRSTVETIKTLSDGMPAVMKVAVDSAQLMGAEGFQDRKMLFEIAGVKKKDQKSGMSINLNQYQFGTEGTFEKLVTKAPIGLNKNPFDVEIVPDEDDFADDLEN